MNSYIQRNRPWKKKVKSTFDEENEQDLVIEQARNRRMQSEPGDEDGVNFDSDMESLWEHQDKLVATLDPNEQEHYLRRLDMQRQGKFKKRCDLLGVLPFSCFRCGHLDHNASKCENFPNKILTKTKCDQCGQGGHLKEDYSGNLKDCRALRNETRRANSHFLRANPEMRAKMTDATKKSLRRTPDISRSQTTAKIVNTSEEVQEEEWENPPSDQDTD